MQVPWWLNLGIPLGFAINTRGVLACPRAAHAPQSCCAKLSRTSMAIHVVAATRTFQSSKPTP